MLIEGERREAGVAEVRARIDAAINNGIDYGKGPVKHKDWKRIPDPIRDRVAHIIHSVEQMSDADVAEAHTVITESEKGTSTTTLLRTRKPVQLAFDIPDGLQPNPTERMGREVVGAIVKQSVTEYVSEQSVGSGHAIGEVGIARPMAMAVYNPRRT